MATKKNPAALEAARADIVKRHGKGAIMQLGDPPEPAAQVISTGVLSLDLALGIGGLPRGRVTEIYGPEASGKTTLALHVIAEAQRVGGVAAFIDADHALDPKYARDIGVALGDLLISQPDNGEQALDIVETLVRSGATDVIVVDSVGALVPWAEIDGEVDDPHAGLQARMMSQALRKLTAAIARTDTALVFVNDLLAKPFTFADPTAALGSTALKYYSSVRLDVTRVGPLKSGDEVVGVRARAKVVKNKMAAPFNVTEFDIRYGRGIDATMDLLDLAALYGVVEKSGAYYAFQGERLAQGREQACKVVAASPALMQALRSGVLSVWAKGDTRT